MKVVNDPPPVKKGKVDWLLVAETARANPGKWVEVDPNLTSGMLTAIKTRQVRAIDPDEFEVTSRRITGTDYRTFYVRVR